VPDRIVQNIRLLFSEALPTAAQSVGKVYSKNNHTLNATKLENVENAMHCN